MAHLREEFGFQAERLFGHFARAVQFLTHRHFGRNVIDQPDRPARHVLRIDRRAAQAGREAAAIQPRQRLFGDMRPALRQCFHRGVIGIVDVDPFGQERRNRQAGRGAGRDLEQPLQRRVRGTDTAVIHQRDPRVGGAEDRVQFLIQLRQVFGPQGDLRFEVALIARQFLFGPAPLGDVGQDDKGRGLAVLIDPGEVGIEEHPLAAAVELFPLHLDPAETVQFPFAVLDKVQRRHAARLRVREARPESSNTARKRRSLRSTASSIVAPSIRPAMREAISASVSGSSSRAGPSDGLPSSRRAKVMRPASAPSIRIGASIQIGRAHV